VTVVTAINVQAAALSQRTCSNPSVPYVYVKDGSAAVQCGLSTDGASDGAMVTFTLPS
jgi:hypothetical protein